MSSNYSLLISLGMLEETFCELEYMEVIKLFGHVLSNLYGYSFSHFENVLFLLPKEFFYYLEYFYLLILTFFYIKVTV